MEQKILRHLTGEVHQVVEEGGGGGQLGLGLGGGDVEAPGLDHAGHGVPVQVLGIVSNVRTVASDSQINPFSYVLSLSHSNGRCAVSPC